MTTYSLAYTGIVPGQDVTPAYLIPDTNLSGNACATRGGVHGTMARGDVFLAQGPDGAVGLYRFDPYRSHFANPVLLKVG